ncbi:MAG: serine hydrolase [Lachnospiraceae bacterium]|nr:serine hydrolase [Lachnospiraceae bacterium]
MPKKLPAYILVVVIGAVAVLIAAFGKFEGVHYIDPNEETVTGEIGSFPPGFTGIEETTRREDPFTMAPTPAFSDETSSVPDSPAETTASMETPEETTEAPSETSGPDTDSSASETPEDSSETTAPVPANEVETDSSAYCVIDDGGNIILAKNPYAHLQPASMTKVLTALIVAENVSSLDEPVTVSEKAVTNVAIMSSGFNPSLKPGEVFTVRELLYALLLPSTNAAANVLAEYVSGTNWAFAELMNAKCASLGLSNAHFLNPHGLDQEGQYCAPYDMAMILRAAVQYSELRTILSALDCTLPATDFGPARTIRTGHAILRGEIKNNGAYAGKSGWTVGANATLVTAYERGGQRLYICTMNSDEKLHFVDTANLADKAYDILQGRSTAPIALIHDLTVSSANDSGITVSWIYGNGVVKGRAVVMDHMDGPESAQFTDFGAVSQGASSAEFHLSAPGIYLIQIFGSNVRGQESVAFGYVLFTGQGKPESGVFTYNHHDYWVNRRGFILCGVIEAASGVYYGDMERFYLIYEDFVNSDGIIYYAGPQGKIVKGWQTIHGKTYYFQADGRRATGLLTIDGQTREFSSEGVLLR